MAANIILIRKTTPKITNSRLSFEQSHINIRLSISHSADMCDCRMSISHSFTYRSGVRRKYTSLPESTFRQVYNLMLEFCHERDAYGQFKDTLFAQVQALICNGKPIGGLVIDANKYFDKGRNAGAPQEHRALAGQH